MRREYGEKVRPTGLVSQTLLSTHQPRLEWRLRRAVWLLRRLPRSPEHVILVLAGAATVGFVAAGLLAGKDRAETGAVAAAAITVVETVTVARETTATVPDAAASPSPASASVSSQPSGQFACELRYVVARGDTLWGIAERNYADGATAMRRIKRRNALGRDKVLAGETLVLPTRGRTTPCPRRGPG